MAEMEGSQAQGGMLTELWQKYGLIVVGNVVFFALLYFIQYRPNSRDNRATELLTLAQREENEGRLEAAETLYGRIVGEYGDTSAINVANERLPKVRALAKKRRETQPPLPAACTPQVDIRELLELKPSLYLAELVAGHYPTVSPAERERYFGVLDDYVWLALNRDNVPLDKLKKSPTFVDGELQRRYFGLKAAARFTPDWMYEDFKVKNQSFFTLHNAVVQLTVSQGDHSETDSLRAAELKPDSEVDVLEFNVDDKGGAILIKGTIQADEGKLEWQQRL
ncbi:MAG: hypothetical protein QM778_20255 [Myxococcales bacterium]